RWALRTGSDVTATPAIAGGSVYFPAWNGMLYAVDEETGRLQWRTNLLPLADDVFNCSRATPVVWKDLLLVSILGPIRARPAIIVAINRNTGAVVWTSPRLDSSYYSMITMSGTAHDRYFYVGTSSLEEVYNCCSFQGSFVKLDISDGSIVWKTSMLPAGSGYYGAALWGSSPSIDEHRHWVFIATGNNYKVPASVEGCENERLQNGTITPDTCLDPANRMDSIVALSMDDGSVVWNRNLQAYDAWTLVCAITPTIPYCPDVLGPDYDFGEAPMIIHLNETTAAKHSKNKNGSRCIVVAGQKSGFVWALDCDTGSIVWSTAAGPAGTIGGAIWGSCTDGKRVYTNIANSNGKNFTLAPGNEVTNGGGWVAMDAATGEVLWSTAEPSGAFAWGPLSVADGVVFATSYSAAGDVYALDAHTGAILWHNTTGAGIYGGVRPRSTPPDFNFEIATVQGRA
ncbi:hypothetical protein KP509_15G013300, partial [Ceratopteris richardii]